MILDGRDFPIQSVVALSLAQGYFVPLEGTWVVSGHFIVRSTPYLMSSEMSNFSDRLYGVVFDLIT